MNVKVTIVLLTTCFINISAPVLAQVDGTPSFKIVRFLIKGNETVKESALQQVVAPYVNAQTSWANIAAARAALIQYYQDRGYAAAVAFLPEQDLSTGNVSIQIIEGKIARIEIAGNRKVPTNWLKNQIDPSPLIVPRLEEELESIRQNPLIDEIKGELVETTELSSPILKLTVVEKDFKPWTLESNNYALPVSGRWENSLTYIDPSASNKMDLLGVKVGFTAGGFSINSLYDLPIDARGTSVRFEAIHSQRRFIEKPISILDLQSSSSKIAAGLNFPIVKRANASLVGSASLSWQRSETRWDGQLFPFSTSSDRGRDEIASLSFGIESRNISSRSANFLTSEATFGLANGEKTFAVWRNSWQHYRRIGGLIARFDLESQLASRGVFPQEQFSLGGYERGKGYRANQYIGDNGLFAEAKLEFPVTESISIAPFAQFGRVWSQGYGDTILSTGVSASWRLGDLTFKGDLSFPLNATANSDRFLFSIGYNFR